MDSRIAEPFGDEGRAIAGTDVGTLHLRDPLGAWSCQRAQIEGQEGSVALTRVEAVGAAELDGGFARLTVCGIGAQSGRETWVVATTTVSESQPSLGPLTAVLTSVEPLFCRASAEISPGVVLFATHQGPAIVVDREGNARRTLFEQPFGAAADSLRFIDRAGEWTAGIHRTGLVLRARDGVVETVYGTARHTDQPTMLASLEGEVQATSDLMEAKVACPNRVSLPANEWVTDIGGGLRLGGASFELQPIELPCTSRPSNRVENPYLRLCLTPEFEVGRELRFGSGRLQSIAGDSPPYTYVFEDGIVLRPGEVAQVVTSDGLWASTAFGRDRRLIAIGGNGGKLVLAAPR
ncbi:MAG: hypothetical protein HYV07_23540 [Deltaproteobacteria bacterium]|nr:hypothetical protein [Deltaproteobacteria bacterium]